MTGLPYRVAGRAAARRHGRLHRHPHPARRLRSDRKIMAIAEELTINTSATAEDMFNLIFGDGIQLVAGTATFSGDTISSGIYSGALTTIPGISPTDTGVILSTGNVADFTNSSGTTDTNVRADTSTDTADGIDGDADLNILSGVPTFDGAILTASFIPVGDFLTMQFVFSSEEYPEYVNQSFNDAFGVWINGEFVPVSVAVQGNVSINSVNVGSNANLYIDNTGDQYNTEMDGFTYVLSFKARVNPDQVNSIKIGIADGGDAFYDSNLLIMASSMQTVVLAIDDQINVIAGSTRTFDILANDTVVEGGLTITQINGQNILPGQTVTLPSGQQITLNADGTITVNANGLLGEEVFSYTVSDGIQTDIGYVTMNTVAAPTPDGIVSGTSGDDLIDATYSGDPDGDRVDNNDGLGVMGTTGDADVIYGGGGNDTILSGQGNDIVDAGAGNDSIESGQGNDTVAGGDGNDTLMMGSGDDLANGEAGADLIDGQDGNDTLNGGLDDDTLTGGNGNDTFVWTGQGNDIITDFGNDDGGPRTDGDQTNNDFVNLAWLFNDTTVAAYNTANGTAFAHPVSAMNHDLADGRIDFNGTDMTGPTLTFQGLAEPLTYDQTNVTCFVRGTRIKTDRGEVAIEDLSRGDRVLTLDNGYQPIRWIGSTRRLAAGALAPIQISAGVLGNDRDLRVSPQHRMLLRGWQAELMFGELEVLATAKSLVNDGTIRRIEGGEVEYFHMLFDQHEIIFAEGAASESFHPGAQGLKALDQATRDELLDLFPNLSRNSNAGYGMSARLSLRDHEGRALASAIGMVARRKAA
jgi:Ca2+-binding RTX toxin-like protein